MKEKYLYSIIIPHHNTVQLLKRMLNSIPNRNDIQIIVVDDCSQTEELVQLKQINHHNLDIVLLKENHGAGYARNRGLEKAQGKWLIFVDSDDLFADNAFEVFDNNISDDIDYLCFCIKCFDEKSSSISKYKDVANESVKLYLKKGNQYTLNRFKYKNTVCWNKLVSHQFIKKQRITFEECEVNNDVYYALQIGHYSRSFKVIEDELYFYMVNNHSLTHKKRSIHREYLFYLQVQKRNGLYKKLGLNYYPFYRHTILYIPFIIMKRGFVDFFRFFYYVWKHRNDIRRARYSYISILDS